MKQLLNKKQIAQCDNWQHDYSHLSALFINCTLKRSPDLSHTDGLVNISRAIMERQHISVE